MRDYNTEERSDGGVVVRMKFAKLGNNEAQVARRVPETE